MGLQTLLSVSIVGPTVHTGTMWWVRATTVVLKVKVVILESGTVLLSAKFYYTYDDSPEKT